MKLYSLNDGIHMNRYAKRCEFGKLYVFLATFLVSFGQSKIGQDVGQKFAHLIGHFSKRTFEVDAHQIASQLTSLE